MSGGGKGSKQKTEVKIPKHLERASKEAIDLAKQVGQIGFIPYQGPVVAPLSQQQQAAIQNTGSAAAAFGMAPGVQSGGGSSLGQAAGMPPPQTFAGGYQGYSYMPLYEEAIAAMNPEQMRAIEALFKDPRRIQQSGSGTLGRGK